MKGNRKSRFINGTDGTVTEWFDYLEHPTEMNGELTIEIPEYPGVEFKYTKAQIIASKPFNDSDLTGQTILIDGKKIQRTITR